MNQKHDLTSEMTLTTEVTTPSANRALAGRWKPGQSGNPSGRPKTAHLSRAIREHLSEASAENPELTNAQQIARALTIKAKKGDTAAASFLADRAEGKVPASLDLNVGLVQRFQSMSPAELEAYAATGQLPFDQPHALPPAQVDEVTDAEFTDTPSAAVTDGDSSLDLETVERMRDEVRRKNHGFERS